MRTRRISQVFDGPEVGRVVAYAERLNEGLPENVRKNAVFYHLRAWASSRLPLPRGKEFPPLVPIELVYGEGGVIVGVQVHV